MYNNAMIQANVKINGDSAMVELDGGTSGEVKSKVERYIRSNGSPVIQCGIVRHGPFRFVCRLYYRLGVVK